MRKAAHAGLGPSLQLYIVLIDSSSTTVRLFRPQYWSEGTAIILERHRMLRFFCILYLSSIRRPETAMRKSRNKSESRGSNRRESRNTADLEL